MTGKTYRIPGISCSLCAMALQSLEDDLPGVKRVNASYRHQRLEVEFDETLLSEADLLTAIAQLGYEVERNSDDVDRGLLVEATGHQRRPATHAESRCQPRRCSYERLTSE